MKINFTEVTDIEDLRAIPPGEYPCQVAEVRESRSPAGHMRWGIRWEVLTGDWEGRTACWDSLHWSDRSLPRAKYVLQTLGVPAEGVTDLEASALVGLKALVTITPEEREDPVTGVRRLTNRVPFAGYASLAK